MITKTVMKEWGRELWFANTLFYLGKVIYMDSNASTSLHFHMKKDETILVWQGTLKVEGDIVGQFTGGDIIHVPPLRKHRLISIGDDTLILFEVSTPHPDDNTRVEEDGDSSET